MSLSAGTRLGTYENLTLIGSGGMGEVYRARDTKLNRDVAIKVLPESLATDPERLARFRREAHVLAALNHPNIAQIYGFEDSTGVLALIMELVEGPTLADRMAQGAIPIDEALPIAKQIADALESAHEQSIVHRDLKPVNIKVRPDGTVKVLDFGLAKALAPAASVGGDATASPTITSPAVTRMGVLLGTAAYMSPEQAKGRPADKRTDVWAFGCVLYEMLTGRRAFGGDDVSDTLAAVLRGEPDWTAWPATVPPHIRALVEGCLRKDRKERVADISTARFVFDHGASVERAGPTASVSKRHLVALSVIAATAVAVASYTAWMLKPAPVPPVARFTIQLPIGDSFSNVGVHVVALSADGSRLAYTANQRLYVRTMNQLEALPIRLDAAPSRRTGAAITDAAPRGPFFSPDGQWIGFWQDGQLKKVAMTGGAPIVLCAAENPWGATWTADNTIVYGQGDEGRVGIWRVSGDGGTPEHFVKLEAGQVAQGPQLLPGGRAILFTLARRDDWEKSQIVVQSLDTSRRQLVLERGADARYVPTGHLVYALAGTLFVVPFNVTTLAVSGSAVPVAEDVAQGNVTAQFAVSSQGALAYVPRDAVERGVLVQRRTLVWVDRHGREDPIKAAPRRYLYPRLSPDGTRVALEIRDPQGSDIWIWDLARETLTRLTLTPTFDQYGVWTPDGRSLIFASSQLGGPHEPRALFKQSSDGAGAAEQLTEGAVAQFPSTVTPDGTALIFRADTPPAKLGASPGMDLLLLPLQGDRRARPLIHTAFAALNGEVSPDGRWLAYQSNESGQNEIYVRPFPNVEAAKRQVSTNGGRQPLWARNGGELFYESTGALMRVPVTAGSAFEAGTPRKLIDGAYVLFLPPGGGLGRMYDVSPDAQRFLMIKQGSGEADDAAAPPRIILVQNWFEELKQRVPTK